MPKILTLDIETAPLRSYHWGLWDQNIGLDMIETEWSILSYAAKWLGEKRILYKDTGGRGKAKVRDDKELLEDLWNLLDTADIVVAQNGQRFDLKRINARLIMHGFTPYSPVRVVDTLVAAKRHFGFTSNKLAWTSLHLTDSPKSDHKKFPGFELWKECLADNPLAWKEMRKYNPQDVIATEKLYLKLLPWITSHPNRGAYNNSTAHQCPKCESTHVQARGQAVLQQGRYQRYQCQDCGGWSRGKLMHISTEKRKSLLV
jgi:predicted RNA-binding Zn-ribbon protein involved in translation (DUF1610 family)